MNFSPRFFSQPRPLQNRKTPQQQDIDAVDEYVRNTTARAFAVVASALGVPALLPFLKAVCRSKKSWQARHTGIKIVQQTAILLGCGVLPHLSSLVAVVAGGLSDAGAPKVRTMAGLALAALAEAAAPYGIDAFDDVLEPLWKGVRLLRGKALAAYLKAIGNIIPLMDATYANYYTREVRGVLCFCFCFLRREKEERETHLSKKKKKQVMVVLLREFASPDDEMKRIVLKVVAQCVGADGVPASYVRDEVLPGFFEHFWVRRMALDRRAYKSVLETTVEVARKVGGACVLGRIVEDLKDEAEPYRRLVMDAVRRILREQGAADVDARLEELLVDGALYAYQEQGDDDGDEKSNSASSKIVLDGFGAIVSSLGRRAKPYLAQVCGTIKWRLNNRAPRVRAQAADLVAAVAPTMVRFFFFSAPRAPRLRLSCLPPGPEGTKDLKIAHVCLPSLSRSHLFFTLKKTLGKKKTARPHAARTSSSRTSASSSSSISARSSQTSWRRSWGPWVPSSPSSTAAAEAGSTRRRWQRGCSPRSATCSRA